MGLVTNDIRDWLAEPKAEADTLENPFGAGAVNSAEAQLDAYLQGVRNRVMYRFHKWLDPDWEPESDHRDGLTR